LDALFDHPVEILISRSSAIQERPSNIFLAHLSLMNAPVVQFLAVTKQRFLLVAPKNLIFTFAPLLLCVSPPAVESQT
jgi:hypothetical protein